jgi:hypothetical protein
MSAEKKYTERDLVLAKREGFRVGYRAHYHWFGEYREKTHPTPSNAWNRCAQDEAMKAAYPLPTVTRPRVVPDPMYEGVFWLLDQNGLRVKSTHSMSEHYPRPGEGLDAIKSRLAVWADLLANPTEECDADE